MMGSNTEHKDKIVHNQNMLTVISNSSSFPDWEIILMFHVALHCVECHFAQQTPPIHNNNHSERNEKIGRYLSNPILRAYLRLYNRAKTARYTPTSHIQPCPTQLRTSTQAMTLILNSLS